MKKTTYDDEKRIAVLTGGQIIYAVHKSTQCYGEVCPIHAPSGHKLIDYPLTFDPMIGSFFRDVDGELVIDPDDYRLNRNGEVILSNVIQCNHCGSTIESTHQHDFRYCSCGRVAVDGGAAYLRRLGSGGDWTELSKIFYREDS